MERNSRVLCTGNLHHIHIRYLFVKDRQEKGKFSVDYFPTHKILTDYFTKALQGKFFNVFREIIMGWKHVNELEKMWPSPSNERVEKWMKSITLIFHLIRKAT